MHYFKAIILDILGYALTAVFVLGTAYLIEFDLQKSHWEWGNLAYTAIALGTPVILGILANFYFANEEVESSRKNGLIFGGLFFLVSGIIDIAVWYGFKVSNPCSGNVLLYAGQLFFWLNISFTLLATTVSARLNHLETGE